ncbi:DUF4855 domain-containing protein [Paenibacillus thermoaerophilus]|uniref:DUF4855 domain-containing protein n=1 Tax=Paenibacillus thermoaerophilus TaxID=1215385 RepID=A0ABW2V795_9BACL|nr:DUF4855 domain-containing protein [Paenibacillus thermoaerophilus]TMV17681.1 DUF4855 domain-containing protein [Paenibacillus thermoaerophilus]
MKKRSNVTAALLSSVLAAGLILPAAAVASDNGQASAPLENLALNKPYTFETPYPRDSHFGPIEDVHLDDTGLQLTDGVFGGLSFSDKAYVGRLWQGYRTFHLDLGELATIEEIRVSTLQDLPNGIFFPEEVSYAISDNGQKWRHLGQVESALPTTLKGPAKQTIAKTGIHTVARYVQIDIPAESWLFVDEIEVIGRRDKSGDKLKPAKGPKPDEGYPRPGSKQAAGIHNEVLIYTGEWQYQPSDWISFTKEDFKPYVSYVDTDMKRKDYMFDGFLFLPYAPLMDGANYGPTAGKPTNKGHFEKFLDRLFRDDYELGALNEAVKEAKADLRGKNYEAKVVIAIPYPRTDQSDFGDVDGDGISENLNVNEVGEAEALNNRLKVTKWFVDEVYKRWEASGYSDLKLVSFYWYNEYIAHQLSELDHELVKRTGDYVRSKGATFQWIPYYFARGWNDWKENGFDAAAMQPNYFFHANAGPDRVGTIAQAAYDHGMGVEIELSDAVLTDANLRGRYYAYLDAGKEHQLMKKSYNVFYQQVKTLWKAAQSKVPVEREVYDRTYLYVKGKY